MFTMRGLRNLFMAFLAVMTNLHITIATHSYNYRYASSRGPSTFVMEISPAQGQLIDAKLQLRKIRNYLIATFTHVGHR